MADEDVQSLIRLGPFGGIDATSAQEYIKPGFGAAMSNVDPSRYFGGMTNARGRELFVDFSTFGLGDITGFCVLSDIDGSNDNYLIVVATDGTQTGWYDAETATWTPIKINTSTPFAGWQRAVVLFNVVYFDNGYCWSVVSNTKAFLTQYPQPFDAFYGNTVSLGMAASTLIGGLDGATYYYAFTRINVPDTVGRVPPGQHLETSADSDTQNGASLSIVIPPPVQATGLLYCTWAPTGSGVVTVYIGNTGYSAQAAFTSSTTEAQISAALAAQINADVQSGLNTWASASVINFTSPPYDYILSLQALDTDGTYSGGLGNAITWYAAVTPSVGVTVGPTSAAHLSGGKGYYVIITPNASFSGTNPDGSTWKTNIYRESSNQPGFNLVTVAPPAQGTAPYDDQQTDAQIAANAGLTIYRDPPPQIYPDPSGGHGPNMLVPPQASHKGFMLVFTVVSQETSGAGPQKQVWFSNDDRPWEFNATPSQVLLVDDGMVPRYDVTGTVPTPQPYGSYPVAVVSDGGSVALLFGSRSTWILLGDSAADFAVERLFGIGLIGRRAACAGNGMIAWQAPDGPRIFAGGAPQWIGLQVWNLIRYLSWNDREACVVQYQNFTFYFSYPNNGFTLCYFLPLQMWYQLPYAMSEGYSSESDPQTYTAGTGSVNPLGFVLGARAKSTKMDYWAAAENDLTNSQTCTYSSPITSSGSGSYEKIYRYIVLYGPVQARVTATVTLQIDPGLPTGPPPFVFSFDMSGNSTNPEDRQFRKICAISVDQDVTSGNVVTDRGFAAQLTVSFTVPPGAHVPVQVWSAEVWGYVDRHLSIPSAS
jgi:hypothetical protein